MAKNHMSGLIKSPKDDPRYNVSDDALAAVESGISYKASEKLNKKKADPAKSYNFYLAVDTSNSIDQILDQTPRSKKYSRSTIVTAAIELLKTKMDSDDRILIEALLEEAKN